MSKLFYTTLKPKYGSPRHTIYGYDNGELVLVSYHRQGLETQMAEAIMVTQGYTKDAWENKPLSKVLSDDDEDSLEQTHRARSYDGETDGSE